MKSVVAFVCLWTMCTGINENLLDNLWDYYWPWFGPCNTQCVAENITCFDVRKYSRPDSIMGRAGFNWMKPLPVTINVTFQAPAETIDICGTPTEFAAVDPFMLHPDGLPYAEDLDRGAEIYRKKPQISWAAVEERLYSLIFLDVGYFRLKGYWIDIKKENGHLRGKVALKYTPPSNPTSNINPILIVLFEHTTPTNPINSLISNCVLTKGRNKDAAEDCRSVFSTFYAGSSDMKLIGAQVYYTNGHSFFEQYHACTESFPCTADCVAKFKSAVSTPTYLDLQRLLSTSTPVTLDHYVGVRFQSEYRICVDDKNSKNVNVRTRPGEQYAIDERDILNNIYIEIGPQHSDYFKDLYYDAMVFFVDDKDVVHSATYVQDLSLTYLRANHFGFRLCPRLNLRRFFVLLLSHTENDPPKTCCKGRIWELDKMPPGTEIRAATSLYVHGTEEALCMGQFPQNCDKRMSDYAVIGNFTSETTKRTSEETRHELMCPLSTTTRRPRTTLELTTTELPVPTEAATPQPPAGNPAPSPPAEPLNTTPAPTTRRTTRRRATTIRRTTTKATTTAAATATSAVVKLEEVNTTSPVSGAQQNNTDEGTTPGLGARYRVGMGGALVMLLSTLVLACTVIT